MYARVLAAAALCASLAACSSGGGSPGTSSGRAVTGTYASICAYLKSTGALKRAGDLAADGSGADSAAVSAVRAQLRNVLSVAPAEMRTALRNLVDQVGNRQHAASGPGRPPARR